MDMFNGGARKRERELKQILDAERRKQASMQRKLDNAIFMQDYYKDMWHEAIGFKSEGGSFDIGDGLEGGWGYEIDSWNTTPPQKQG